jgi:ketosteroid isomerase-like protein
VTHPNEDLLRKGYDAFGKGDLETLRNEVFDPNLKWHVPGRNQIAGDYNGVDEVFGFFGKIAELSGGNFGLEVHDVVANDTHVIGLVTAKGQRDGKTLEDHNVHIWHVQNGKLTEFWGHAQDQYAVDDFWS